MSGMTRGTNGHGIYESKEDSLNAALEVLGERVEGNEAAIEALSVVAFHLIRMQKRLREVGIDWTEA